VNQRPEARKFDNLLIGVAIKRAANDDLRYGQRS